ncbi:PREDICTED: uncharacterized protein LOC105141310 [Populus euphratica]|uniref:Uncharacterized protein LOC105141310 n=1 Tax=Populus euphratica TaxID=75702 RepID=A0AAJ6Y8V9_POPEU|nr:PREDICTED: uncharacterized protein LOC105141310 [Populus euphratica]
MGLICFWLQQNIWDAVRQTYSKVKDVALIYEIKMKLSMTKQGNMMVIEYYNTMKSFWLELDYYQDFKMQCSDDAVILKNYVERERIFEFLAGLNIEFDQMRVQILGKESLPSLNEVFSIIRAEEGRRTVMLEVPNTKGSAMMITNRKNLSDASRNQNDDEPMKLYCDNKSAIAIAHNPVQHDRTKHVEVDKHFIKEKLESGLICTPYVPTGEQLADILTKGV